MPVFFIEPGVIKSGMATVRGPLAHHLSKSLRVEPGEELWLAEAGERRYRAKILSSDLHGVTAQILFEVLPPSKPSLRITLGLALIKHDHLAWALQKATELGVAEIVPLITRRTVVRPIASRQTQRLRTIVLEAAQQSMRWDVPFVTDPQPFHMWCRKANPEGLRFLLWESPQGTLLRDKLKGDTVRHVVLAAGPEGGFETEEITEAQGEGFEVVSLGPRILRTETSVLTALAVLQYEWGDLGKS